ncbi:choice-of-anchor J domain-containing protein [Flavobacteriales bacterium AH-315-E23]|nr:choice-of-anchor J domain-containing protein [Flavobacteriales bacterium AH-315-E23]
MLFQRRNYIFDLAVCTVLSYLSCSFQLRAQGPAKVCGTPAIYQSDYFDASLTKQELLEYPNYVKNLYNKVSQSKYIIPVAVHIVHQGGVENISDSQVRSAITALNNDYRKIPGTKGHASGVDTEIEFALATIDPSGNPTTGITRDSSALSDVYYAAADSTFFANDSIMKTSFGWPPDKYMNVFVVTQIDNGNVLGYAFYPPYMAGSIWAGTYSYDGIVVAYEYWGTEGTAAAPWDLGATATHEVGHWLGLFHPFEIEEDNLPDGCACTNCITCADRVCDTPPTYDPNFGFPARRNSCSNDLPDVPDQVRNYMDYGDDAHIDMFSEGQKTRMHFFMDNDTFRMALSTVANHQATGVGEYGPLEAGFTSEWREVDAGASIGFESHELNAATSYSWIFDGGTPSSSTLANPTITYNNAGVYDVTLIVSNSVSDDTLLMSNYITVNDTVVSLPFSEDFEGTVFPPAGWRVLDPDSAGPDSYTWESSTLVGGFGQSAQSASVRHAVYHIPNQKDGLVLPALDLTNMQSAELVFTVAYEPYDTLFWLDTLSVLVSTDLGSSWVEVWRKGGEQLATNNNKASYFIPDSTEWRTDTADISAASGSIALVKFEALNKYGNNLYIDDIAIDGVPLGIEGRLDKRFYLHVFPNPFSTSARVEIDVQSPMAGDMELHVYNMLGKLMVIYPLNINTDMLKINSADLGAGIFILQLRGESRLLNCTRIAIVR